MVSLKKIFQLFQTEKVVNLAVQVGVRYSLENSNAYIKSIIVGFMNVLDCPKFINWYLNCIVYVFDQHI